MNSVQIILASSSQTRKALMDRLHIDYISMVPDIDESPRGENHADDLAQRLAFEKARYIAEQNPEAIVIGSDQVAWREGAPDIFIGKPLTTEKPFASSKLTRTRLSISVRRSVYSNNRRVLNKVWSNTIKSSFVNFQAEIERYVEIEQPLHCAGSFKCESLGISLFEEMTGQDQTTLMGMPMIKLCNILRELKF